MSKDYEDVEFEETEYDESLFEETDYDESLFEDEIRESEPVRSGQTHFRNPETGRTEPLPEGEQGKTIQPIDAVAQGMVAGLPKEVLSAGEAAIQAMEKGSLEDLGEDYANNRDEYIEAYREAEKLYPGLTLGSDMVTTLAGPGKIKLGTQAALGAASAGSRVKSDDPWEMAQQASMGGLLTFGLGAAGKYVSDKIAAKQLQVGKHLGAIADESTLDLVDHGKNRKKLNNFIAKVFNKDGSKTRVEATEEFVQYTEKYKYNGTKLFDIGDTIDDTSYKSRQIMKEVGERKSELLKKYDRPLTKSEVKALYEQQKEELINIYSQDKLGLSEDTGQTVLKRLEQDFYETIEETTETIVDSPIPTGRLTPEGTQEFLRDSAGNIIKKPIPMKTTSTKPKLKEFKLSDIERRKRRLDEIFYDKKQTATDISDKHYFRVTGQSNRKFLEDAVPEMRDINKEYNVIREIAERSGEVASGRQGGVVSKVKNMLNLRTVFLASAAAGSGMGDVPKMTVLGIANKLVSYANDPSLTAKTAHRLRVIGRHLQNDPGSSTIRRLAAYSHLPFEDFRDKVAGLAGEIVLGEKALARTADDALTRSDDILAAARGVDKALATELKEILESGNEDAIGAFMDGLSKDPRLSKFFEPGLGFNGKVYDPQDKAMLEEQLRANDDIPYAQKLQLIDDLNKNGTIPQPQEQAPDFMEFMTRNKDKPEY